jgi:hypothetical protein
MFFSSSIAKLFCIAGAGIEPTTYPQLPLQEMFY